MVNAIGIQFRSGIKVYDFLQEEHQVKSGDLVLVETSFGEEIGRVIYTNKQVEDDSVKQIKKVLTDDDIEKINRRKQENWDYSDIFTEAVKRHHLEMKFVDFDFTLDEEKVIFFFTAEGRVDFRELVRELSRKLKKTVILRQMGQRDEARLLDGFGACGQTICCRRFLKRLENITMDMVREQYEGTRSASKVSGVCGRLMCCLAFETKFKDEKGDK